MQGRLSAADLGRISVDEEYARRQRHSRRRRDLVAGALEGGSEAAHSHVDAGAWVPVHRGRGVRYLPLIIISAPNVVITLLITLASHFLLVSPILHSGRSVLLKLLLWAKEGTHNPRCALHEALAFGGGGWSLCSRECCEE